MMSDPVFRSYSNQQSSRPAPFQKSQQRSSPKVVSVPVHFISSDQPRMTLSMLKDSAAIRIQRVFRGFLVRKSVKKIATIRNEVTEIQRRIADVEVVGLIRRDAKERLRVNETLMSLLFKLDSIHGVDCGVRDLRKAVTKTAIALQEKVDFMAQAEVHQTLDSRNNDSVKIDDGTSFLEQQVTETSVNSEPVKDGGAAKEIVENCKIGKPADRSCNAEEDVETMRKKDNACVEVQEKENDMGNEEVIESLMADNQKMMKLMMQIFETNEMQTRMINSLSRRVEQLEKALTTDRMRRKKKTHVALRRRDKDNFCIFGGNGL